MSSSPTVPTPPNAGGVANTQTGLNTTAAQSSQAGSMVNQVNPYGSLSYAQTGTGPNGTPLYTATTSLSPTQQKLLQTLTGTQQTAGGDAAKLLAGAGYGNAQPSDVIGNATKGLTQQAMAQEMSYLDPTFTQQTQQIDTQLRNQGFTPGSPGYQQAMNGLLQSQGQTKTGFLATMEPQMFQQATQEYQMPAQMAQSLATFGAPTTPNASFVQTPQLSISPANYEGDVASSNAAQMAAYQAQLGQSNAMMSGLFGTGSAVLGGLAKSGQLGNLLGAAALA